MVGSWRTPWTTSVAISSCHRVGVPVEQSGGHGPLQVEVGVVLPGEADAAEHLDAVLRTAVGRFGPECGGDGDRERRALVVAIERAGGIPRRGASRLERTQHVGAPVLHGLELSDGPTELLALAGIGGGRLDAPCRRADALGRDEQRGERLDGTVGAGERVGWIDGDAVRDHATGAARPVDAGQ